MDYFLGAVVFVLGLVVGSFVNVVGLRLPQKKSILGRSQCQVCQKILTFRELIPVFSFLVQKGFCRSCGTRLSWQYPLIELGVALWFLAVWLVAPFASAYSLSTIFYLWLLGSILFAIIIADWHYQVIPDVLVAGLAVLAIFWLGFLYFSGQAAIGLALFHLAAGLGAGAFLLLLWAITRGQGMGLGDVKLAAALGLILGVSGTIAVLFVSFVSGALIGIGLILAGRKSLKSKISFGPFLAASTLLVLLFQLIFPNLLAF